MTTVAVPHASPQRQQYPLKVQSEQENLIPSHHDQAQSHPSLQAKLHEAREQNRIFGSANSQASISDVSSNVLNGTSLHGSKPLNNTQFQILRHFSLSDPTVIFPETTKINGSQSFAESSIHMLVSSTEPNSKSLGPPEEIQNEKENVKTGEDEKGKQNDKEARGWGTRHGFEDHYSSEEYVSQLANVGFAFSCHSKVLQGSALSTNFKIN